MIRNSKTIINTDALSKLLLLLIWTVRSESEHTGPFNIHVRAARTVRMKTQKLGWDPNGGSCFYYTSNPNLIILNIIRSNNFELIFFKLNSILIRWQQSIPNHTIQSDHRSNSDLKSN